MQVGELSFSPQASYLYPSLQDYTGVEGLPLSVPLHISINDNNGLNESNKYLTTETICPEEASLSTSTPPFTSPDLSYSPQGLNVLDIHPSLIPTYPTHSTTITSSPHISSGSSLPYDNYIPTWKVNDSDVYALAQYCKAAACTETNDNTSSLMRIAKELQCQFGQDCVDHPLFSVLLHAYHTLESFKRVVISVKQAQKYEFECTLVNIQQGLSNIEGDHTGLMGFNNFNNKNTNTHTKDISPCHCIPNIHNHNNVDKCKAELNEVEKEIFLLIDSMRLLSDHTVTQSPQAITSTANANKILIKAVKVINHRLIQEHEAYLWHQGASEMIGRDGKGLTIASTDMHIVHQDAVVMPMTWDTAASNAVTASSTHKLLISPRSPLPKRKKEIKRKVQQSVDESPYTAPHAVAAGKRSSFKPRVIKLLKEWLSMNTHHAYPTIQEKQLLSSKTNLTIEQ
eukprot:Ihof_evm6s116 gene=Ihof_evmTU6s116